MYTVRKIAHTSRCRDNVSHVVAPVTGLMLPAGEERKLRSIFDELLSGGSDSGGCTAPSTRHQRLLVGDVDSACVPLGWGLKRVAIWVVLIIY